MIYIFYRDILIAAKVTQTFYYIFTLDKAMARFTVVLYMPFGKSDLV